MKTFTGKYGWKTLLAVTVLVVVTALQQLGIITDANAQTVQHYAEALGLWGIRRALVNS